MSGFVVQRNKPFSIGDKIQVADLKGQVIEMGVLTASLLTAENRRTVVPTSWLSGQEFVNKTRDPSHAMACKIFVDIEEIEKIPEISEEIRNMMRSEPLIYLEQEQPYCNLSGLHFVCVTLSFGCNLKHVSEDELFWAEDGIMMKTIEIIEKHGGS